MSGRYWGLIAAAVFGLTAYAFQAGVGFEYLSHQEKSYPSYKDATDNERGVDGSLRLNVESAEYKTPCRNPESRDESDLCAQWEAANNSAHAARWAYWQLVLSAFGVFGLVGTILLTIRATNAAVRANEIAQEKSDLELRPYVYVGDVTVTLPFTVKSLMSIKFKNHGLTPAIDISFGMDAGIYRRPIGDEGRDLEVVNWADSPPLGPQAETTIYSGFGPITSFDVETVRSGSYAIVFRLVIKYRSRSGIEDAAEMTMFVDEETAKTGNVLALNEWARTHLGPEPDDEYQPAQGSPPPA